MEQSSSYWTRAKDQLISDLQKDIQCLRATVKVKDDTIKDMSRQSREKDTKIKLLEIDLKMAKSLCALHEQFFRDSIKPQPFQESTCLSSTTRLRTTL